MTMGSGRWDGAQISIATGAIVNMNTLSCDNLTGSGFASDYCEVFLGAYARGRPEPDSICCVWEVLTLSRLLLKLYGNMLVTQHLSDESC